MIEDEVRAMLADRVSAAPTNPRRQAEVRGRIRTLKRRVAGGGAAVVMLAAAGVSVPTVAARLGSDTPSAAGGVGQLPWGSRGELAGDRGLLQAAARVWQSTPSAPAGEVSALYAGRVDADQVVVLQGRVAGGTVVAELTDRGGALHLLATAPIRVPTTIALRVADPDQARGRTLLLLPPGTTAIALYDRSGLLAGSDGGEGYSPVDDLLTTSEPSVGRVVTVERPNTPTGVGTIPSTAPAAVTSPVTPTSAVWGAGRPGDPGVAAMVAATELLDGAPAGAAKTWNTATTVERASISVSFTEIVRDGQRYVGSFVRVTGRTYCPRLQRVDADSPDAVLLRCPLPQVHSGVVAVFSRAGIDSGRLTLGGIDYDLALRDGPYLATTPADFPTGPAELKLADAAGVARPTLHIAAYQP